MKRLIKSSAYLAVSLTAIIGMSTVAVAQQVDIIPWLSTWDYLFTSLDDGGGSFLPADPITANNVDFSNWSSVGFQTTTLTFDDGRSAPWQSGFALFGQGDANVTYGTEFPQPAANNRNVTQYFRHEFTTGQEFVNLTMSLIVDDGAVVYLDGAPVSSMMSCCRNSSNVDYDVADPNDPRFGTAPGYRDRSTVTNGPPQGTSEGFIYSEILASIDTLSTGQHVISVETHQASTNSSDSRFDFRFFQNVDNEWTGEPANNGGFYSGEWDDTQPDGTATFWAAGTIPNGAGATATLAQVPTRSATVWSNGDVTLGTLEFDNSSTYAIAGHGTFIFATSDGSNATIDVTQGDHEIQAKVALTNSVDITTAAGSSFEFNNDVNGNGNSINIAGAGTARVNGAMIDVTVNAAAGAMTGGGSVGGDLINSGAVLSPGDDVGVLSVIGNFLQSGDGVLAIDLAGIGDYDLLDIQGSAEFGGALSVSLLGDFEPSLGDEFDILNFSSSTGSFDSMSLPGLADGLQWDMSDLYVAGSLAVVPEPAGILLLLCGGFAFGLIRRSDNKMKRVSRVMAPFAGLAALVLILNGGLLQAAGPTPDNNVIDFGSSWRYLNPQNLNQDPFNNQEGVDFDEEWFLPNYNEADLTVSDGPDVTLSWQGPVPSPIGYGAIVAFDNLLTPPGFATDIGAPITGERYTIYLRGENFTRPAGVPQNGPFVLEFLADDGMAMYLDGEEVDLDFNDPNQLRYNCCQAPDGVPIPQDFPPTYLDRSLATGGENNFIQRSLDDFTLGGGQHMIAVSLHNQNTDSSDLGFEMRLFVPGNGRTWVVNDNGRWGDRANWDFGVPASRQSFAIFGTDITANSTVIADSPQSLDGIQFENDDSYNIVGTGSVNLQGNSRNASLNVMSGGGSSAGDHEFQVRVNLNNNTDALIEDGSSISFNNRLNLNGRTLVKTGLGDLLVRNNGNTGDGTINVSEGVLGGGGRVSGNVNVSGGNLAPSGSANPSSFSNTLTVSGNANVTTGGAATLAVFGNGDSDAISGGGSGTLTFGGGTTINIVSATGYTPMDGDTAQVLLDWGTINDSGATIIAPGWDTSNLFVDGTIVFGEIIVPPSGCDFNADMLCDTADIDMLTAEIATGGNNPALDVDGDGSITLADRDAWLADAGPKNGLSGSYLLGDANLDGTVGAGDLNELGQRWTQNDNAWSHGDFNADGNVDAGDLNDLGQRWLQVVPAAAAANAVPEPSALGLLFIAALGFAGRGRRHLSH